MRAVSSPEEQPTPDAGFFADLWWAVSVMVRRPLLPICAVLLMAMTWGALQTPSSSNSARSCV